MEYNECEFGTCKEIRSVRIILFTHFNYWVTMTLAFAILIGLKSEKSPRQCSVAKI